MLAASLDRAPYDIDGNGVTDPLSDGIIILRYLDGFTGSALTDGVVDPRGTRTDAASIVSHLREIEDSFLDPDGDVEALPLQDGVVVMRHLAGFSGQSLVEDAVNPQGLRRDPGFVKAYLERLLNEPPAGSVGEFALNEDSVLVVDAASGLLSNITDPDGDMLSASLRTPPGNGAVEIQEDGSFTYTPEANVSGMDSFTFVASDEFGGETQFSVEISVNGINDLPTLREALYSVPNDTLLEVTVDDGLLQFVDDLDGDDVVIQLGIQAENGVVTLEDDGSFMYQPDANFFGSDIFTVSLDDGSGDIVNADARIDVIPTDTKPIAQPLQYYVDEDTRLEVNAENGIFSGGTDADGDTLRLTDFLRPDIKTGEWEYRIDGSFIFTPAPNFNGDTTFQYEVGDSDGNKSSLVTSTITVRSVFDEPVPADDVRDTAKNTKLRLDGEESLLGNDSFGDVEQPEIVIRRPPEHGSIAVEDDGNGGQGLFYTPDTDFLGEDAFTYAVGDGTDSYGDATVSVTVTPRGAVVFDTESGVLTLYGTEGNDELAVDTVFAAATPNGQVTATILPQGQNQILRQFPRPQVTAIRVFGFGGHDEFDNSRLKNNQVGEIQLPIEAFGGAGNDTIRGGSLDDLLVGGDGFDRVIGRGGGDTIFSGDVDGGSDTSNGDLRGGAGNDTIHGGLGGGETLRGGSGNDMLISGGPFLVNDEFPDEGIGDVIYGDDDGNDQFTSEVTVVPGDDTLIGSDGPDYLEGGGGTNTLRGGDGNDRYIFGPDLESVDSEHVISEPSPSLSRVGRDNSIEFRSAAGYFDAPIYYDLGDSENVVDNRLTIRVNYPRAFNSVHGGSKGDFLKGHENFVSNRIFGNDGEDTIYGGNTDDFLSGGLAKDILFGGPGNDTIRGGNHGDEIYGGPGDDNTDGNELDSIIRKSEFDQPTRFGNKIIRVDIEGTETDDIVEVHPDGPTGLIFRIWTEGRPTSEPPDDELPVDFSDAYLLYNFDGLGGDDLYRDLSDLSEFAFGADVNGGLGDDTLIGGGGLDYIVGGIGNDVIEGRGGNDTLEGGVGADTYVFNGSDLGRDVVDEVFDFEFGDGGSTDTLDFSGYDRGIDINLASTDNGAELVIFRTNGLERGGQGIENIVGTPFSDTIRGNGSANRIEGGGGNDFIYALGGNDELFGNDGDDFIEGGFGEDTIDGGDGQDFLFGAYELSQAFDFGNTIRGGDDADVIHGADGIDLLFGDDGDDLIFGHGSHDELYGGRGKDTIRGGKGRDLIFGQEDTDELYGDEDADEIWGGDHDDTIYGGLGNDLLLGEDGRDRDLIERFGTPGSDVIFGGEGNDTIQGENGDDELHGDEDDDTIFGGPGGDFLFGDDGLDYLYGEAGSDGLFGGDNNDYLNGGRDSEIERDYLDGGRHNDELWGGGGPDELFGEHGRDTIYGEGGDDLLLGGLHSDSLIGGSGKDSIAGGDGDDSLLGGDDDDFLEGGDGSDLIIGMHGDDVLIGNDGNDFLYGDLHPSQRTIGLVPIGDDRLYGGPGTDELYGQEGNDALFAGVNVGSAGVSEVMYGGEGANRFLEIINPARLLKTDRSYRDRNVLVLFEHGDARWSENDIIKVDEAFHATVKIRGDNRLLTFPWSPQRLKFIKTQNQPDPGALAKNTKRFNVIADVRPSRTSFEVLQEAIYIWHDVLLNRSRQDMLDTVWHELGHNWHPGVVPGRVLDMLKQDYVDIPVTGLTLWGNVLEKAQPYMSSPYNEAVWNQFLGLSGWVRNPQSTVGRTSALDGEGWWHAESPSAFAGSAYIGGQPYGMALPSEDWATVWSIVFQTRPSSDPVLQQKHDLLRSYILSLPVM